VTYRTWEHVRKVVADNFADTSCVDFMMINGSETNDELIEAYGIAMDAAAEYYRRTK
jgi:hypothetical protein